MYRIGKAEIEEGARVIESRYLFRTGSPVHATEDFEKAWAERIGVRYSICVSGGTPALIAGLVGLEIGPGDEVIVPAYTFMATASAVLAVGAIPVLAEVDDTLTMDPADLASKIGPHTRAVIPVHMVGYPCDMERILDLARQNQLKVLEDACQADGGSYRGRRLGSWGDAGAFSFNHYKIIAAGEGGALATNDRKVYERALIYHDIGAEFRPYAQGLSEPVFSGMQLRVSEVIGAILNAQLKRLDGILTDLRRVKRQFLEELTQEANIRFVCSNDIAGDCGTTLGIIFDSESIARRFAQSEGVDGWLPIDSDKHVYCNWEPILQKRGAHHPALDPFQMAQNQGLRMDYSKIMCPNTLDILSRTVFISLHPDWGDQEVDRRVRDCRKAAAAL